MNLIQLIILIPNIIQNSEEIFILQFLLMKTWEKHY